MLIYAIVFMNLALLFYTVGVWGEKLGGKLKSWHLVLFYIGLVCDTTGTLVMEAIAKSSGRLVSGDYIHGITGVIAIVLMIIHALWATYVLVKKNDEVIMKFHKFSIVVWGIWLIPFLSGVISHMR